MWLGYKSAVVEGIYYGASFQDNAELTDWLDNQPLCSPIACLGDGHEGVWNVFAQVGRESQRLEILDWYHLKENPYKIGVAEIRDIAEFVRLFRHPLN